MATQKDKIQIVILAAGKGKRMQSDEPKALAPFKGKPFITHILETVDSLDLPIKPVIVVGHKKERIFEVLGAGHTFAHQEELLGTGHALLSAKNSTHPEHEIIVVISTDQPLISKETILNIIETHQKKNPAVTIATLVLPDFEEWRAGLLHFGRIIRDEKGQVIRNVEFKDATEEEKKILEVNPAIYAFEKGWLWKNIDKLRNENAQQEYYLTDLIRIANEQGETVEAVPIINILEGIQPNTKEELEILENLTT